LASNFDEGKFSLISQTNNGTRLNLQLCGDLIDSEDKRFIDHRLTAQSRRSSTSAIAGAGCGRFRE